ncbi:MAG: 5-dehydro-2-deoxygluconokinase [Bifidobacteriaceae bacterium]|jgi:5-dehydro-2-deoxygluconokinase|nr:5-dehydro-2-deoxygluconokinase [Bifidobacteriaceae bacterium]
MATNQEPTTASAAAGATVDGVPPAAADQVIDLLAIGRVGVDIYPNQIGLDLADVESFGKYIGGTAANVTVAVARYGHRSALISKVGEDSFGDYVIRDLASVYQVDTEFIGRYRDLPTPVTFCAIKPPEDFPLTFYRTPSAPDMQITTAEVEKPRLAQAIGTARIFWTTGTGLSQEPIRSAQLAALRWRRQSPARTGRYTIFDLDYRPMFWPDPDTAHAFIAAALEYHNVVVGNQTECAVAVGVGSPDQQADRILAAGPELAVVKMGSAGVLGKTADQRVVVPPVPVRTVNGLGAGDAFGGALAHGLLEGWPLERTLLFANAAGAYVASQIACSAAMPDEATVNQLLVASPPTGTQPDHVD